MSGQESAVPRVQIHGRSRPTVIAGQAESGVDTPAEPESEAPMSPFSAYGTCLVRFSSVSSERDREMKPCRDDQKRCRCVAGRPGRKGCEVLVPHRETGDGCFTAALSLAAATA